MFATCMYTRLTVDVELCVLFLIDTLNMHNARETPTMFFFYFPGANEIISLRGMALSTDR